jgi:hypothetical protein
MAAAAQGAEGRLAANAVQAKDIPIARCTRRD